MPRKTNPRLQVRDWSKAPTELKLSIDLIPAPLHHRNLRIAIGDRWRALANEIKRKRGLICEICGAVPQVASQCHAHEEWSYDEDAHPCVAKLERIAIICADCHGVEHFTNAHLRHAEGTLSSAGLAALRRHFYVVNGIDESDVPWFLDYHYEQAQRVYARRSAWPSWRIDFGAFSSLLTSEEVELIQPSDPFLRK